MGSMREYRVGSPPASRTVPTVVVIAALALVLGACTSTEPIAPSTTDQQVDPTTTSPPAATTTATPPTTSATTTTLPATANPEKLLAEVNEVMAAQGAFLFDGTFELSENFGDSEETFSTVLFRGGQDAERNRWIDARIVFTAAEFQGSFDIESREVDGVTYGQEADSGDWNIEEPDGEFLAIEAVLEGEIILDNVSAEESDLGYQITGTVPADPSIETVILDVGALDLALERVAVRTEEPRDEYDGLIGTGDTTVFETEIWEIHDYGTDVASIAPPTELLSTTSAVLSDTLFSLQIPNDWVEATTREKAEMGLAGGDAWVTDEGLLLMVIIEDLEELGFGTIALEEYVTATIALAFSDEAQLDDPVDTTTVQALPAVMLTGTADETSLLPFTRFIFLHEGTIGVNISVVGPKASFEEARGLRNFILNTFLVDDPPLVPIEPADG
jgi:hypothetical protein